eukprot:EG_transcript_5764
MAASDAGSPNRAVLSLSPRDTLPGSSGDLGSPHSLPPGQWLTTEACDGSFRLESPIPPHDGGSPYSGKAADGLPLRPLHALHPLHLPLPMSPKTGNPKTPKRRSHSHSSSVSSPVHHLGPRVYTAVLEDELGPEEEGYNLASLSHSASLDLSPRSQVVETRRLVKGEDEDGNKTINQYAVLRNLGQGQYGKVKLVVHNDTGNLFAIKVMKRSVLRGHSGKLEQLRREIAIMKKLAHDNVVALYEVIDDVTSVKLYLIMQYVENGPVATVANDGSTVAGPMPLDKVRGYVRDMLAGVQYLHHQNIIHRDLKPENMLVGRDDRLRIADFGVSVIDAADKLTSRAGTPAFLAPEVVREDAGFSGKAVDLWALGVTVYSLVYGHLPFFSRITADLHQSILAAPVPYPADIGSPAAVDFLQKILVRDPKARARMPALCVHPFVTAGGLLPSILPEMSPKINTDDADLEQAILQGSNIRLADKIALVIKMKFRMAEAARRARQTLRQSELATATRRRSRTPTGAERTLADGTLDPAWPSWRRVSTSRDKAGEVNGLLSV